MAARTSDMAIQYTRTNSVLSRMDALSKLFAVFLISIYAVIAPGPWALVVLFTVLSVAALTLGKVSFRRYLRGVRVFALFGAGLCIFQLLFNHRGEEVAQILFLPIYSGGD